MPLNLHFATIVSPNYLAYARVLGDSLAQHMPGAAFHVLVVGRPTEAACAAIAQLDLPATWAADLGLADFESLAYKFDLVELNTALKPTFLKRLFEGGADGVVYLDPDIRLFQPLEPVMDALKHAQIVLTPHACAPVMDGKRPSDIDFLRTGAYNLGFIALRRGAQASALLDWWENRCLGHGFNDTGFGTFVDQKWMDLAAAYFDELHVLKHRGCNVAYWNLHERALAQGQDGITVNGQPLCFFHFSGVDARDPSRLSKHQNRHALEPGSALARVVTDYCAALVDAGHERWTALPYGFDTLDDGTPVTSLMRRASIVPGMAQERPFDAASTFQRRLRKVGLHPTRSDRGFSRPVTTLNFDPTDHKVRAVHVLLRVVSRLIGPSRVSDIVRYATFLGWRASLPAVLLDQPLELNHLDVRAARQP